MKFSDVIIAAAFLFVVSLMLDSILFVVVAPLNIGSMIIVAAIISSLVISLIAGYVFAVQIREESRLRAIGSIVILATAGMMLFVVGWFANPLAATSMKDAMQDIYSTGSWTNTDWFAYLAFTQTWEILLTVVFDFIGLYAGSMLKPKKT